MTLFEIETNVIDHWKGELAAAPAVPAEGDVYADTTAMILYKYTGGSWHSLYSLTVITESILMENGDKILLESGDKLGLDF